MHPLILDCVENTENMTKIVAKRKFRKKKRRRGKKHKMKQ
jgi:hypothetical protein